MTDRRMLRRILPGLILACAAGAGIFWWLTVPAAVAPASLSAYTPNLANGLTTFNAGGCSSCHAVPNQPDRLKLGGGLAMPSPFGTFYVPNISSDPTYGIGRWSEADFVTAVLKGTSPDGAHYFPAFPYASYQHATVDDVRDLFAYLKTLAPVGDTAGGSMARVVRNTSQLAPEDRAAIAEYLKSLPPVEGPPRPKKSKDAEKS